MPYIPSHHAAIFTTNSITLAFDHKQEQDLKRKTEVLEVAPKTKRSHEVLATCYKKFWFEHCDFMQARYGWPKSRA